MNSIRPSGQSDESARHPAPERFDHRSVLETSTLSAEASLDGSAFARLGLSRPLVRAVVEEGYREPTPIQAQAIPELLRGRDLLGCAQTGTGKTAAFVLPILQQLSQRSGSGRIRALVLSPTRELAAQIDERAAAYGRHVGIRHAVIYGGVGQRAQEHALARRPELVVATPGRLLDLLEQGFMRLDAVEIFVLDEADRMLDMGFIHDVRRVISALPRRRQTLLFSATLPRDIGALAANILIDPVRVSVTPAVATAEGVEQSVYFVAREHKRALLEHVLGKPEVERALVFTRTKHAANRVCQQLVRAGIEAVAIHGNKSQSARERALGDFRHGRVTVLVATDIAARGIDVEGISHVVNYDLPNVAESYVHRVGRTGRAGARGRAVSFCDRDERALLRGIEKLLQRQIRVAEDCVLKTMLERDPSPRADTAATPTTNPRARPTQRRQRRRRFRSHAR